MTLPGAISTCTVTYGSALTYLGAVSSIEARLTADRSVVWSATGQSLNSGGDLLTASSGAALSFVVPHVDQSGFVDANSDAVTLWYYRLVGTVTFSTGTTMAFAKNFQVLVGQTNVDLDLIDDNATVLPAVVVVGDPVTSVNGDTGAVTIDVATPADASTTVKGLVELATNAETTTGTDAVRAVTPAGLKAVTDALPATYAPLADSGWRRLNMPGSAGDSTIDLCYFNGLVHWQVAMGDDLVVGEYAGTIPDGWEPRTQKTFVFVDGGSATSTQGYITPGGAMGGVGGVGSTSGAYIPAVPPAEPWPGVEVP